MVRVRVGVTRVCDEHWRLRLGSMATQLPHPSPSLTPGLCNPPCIQDDNTPLYWASKKGHRDLAELLLGRKADVDVQNKVTRGEGWEVALTVVGADACVI